MSNLIAQLSKMLWNSCPASSTASCHLSIWLGIWLPPETIKSRTDSRLWRRKPKRIMRKFLLCQNWWLLPSVGFCRNMIFEWVKVLTCSRSSLWEVALLNARGENKEEIRSEPFCWHEWLSKTISHSFGKLFFFSSIHWLHQISKPLSIWIIFTKLRNSNPCFLQFSSFCFAYP